MPSDVAIKIRRGTNAQWLAANPILEAGELGLNTDNNRLKVGNGSLGWNSLSYINISPGDVNEATQDYLGAFLQNGTHDGVDVTYNDVLNTIALVVDRDYIVDKTTAQTLTNKTLTAPQINEAVPLTATSSELNILDGATLSTAELNYVDGVTSPIQTQINNKISASSTDTLTNKTISGSSNSFSNIPNSALINSSVSINGEPLALGGSITLQGELPSQTNNSGKYLKTDGSVASWQVVDSFPLQTNNSGKFLTTDGSVVSWAVIPNEIPSQTGNNGKYLTTNGSSISWATIPVTSQATTTSLGTVYGSLDNNENLSYGQYSLNTTVSGAYNIAVGTSTMTDITTGDNNIGVGYTALSYNTTGSENVAIGVQSMETNYTGNANVAIGYNTLNFADGSNNTAIGAYALYENQSGSNVAIGFQAGFKETSSSNVFVGSEAASLHVEGTNNIAIGTNAQISGVAVSNEIVLGNSSINRFRIPGIGIDWNKNIEIMQIMEAY